MPTMPHMGPQSPPGRAYPATGNAPANRVPPALNGAGGTLIRPRPSNQSLYPVLSTSAQPRWSSRASCPGSIPQQAPTFADGWIPVTSTGTSLDWQGSGGLLAAAHHGAELGGPAG